MEVSTVRSLRHVYGILWVLAGVSWLCSSALGASLTEIAPLGADTSSEARAITPDGKFVVGQSGTGTGFIWDAVNGARTILAQGSQLSTVRGIAYRTIDVEGVPTQQMVVQGFSAGWHTNAFSVDGGLTWPIRLRQTGWPQSNNGGVIPLYNSMSAGPNDHFYDLVWRSNELILYLMRGQGSPPVINVAPDFVFGHNTLPWDTKSQPSGAVTSMRGIDQNGRSVGTRRDATNAPNPRRNYVFEYTGAGAPVNYWFTALDGTTRGEAWATNADGSRVFGFSPVSDGRPGNWAYVVVDLVNAGGETGTIQSEAHELPTYPDVPADAATASVPYGASADGLWAVGHNYRGQERAVLWDLRDADPENWKVYDLTAYFGASGLLGSFTRLDRAFSVGIDTDAGDVVVSGRGITAAGTRAFVAHIPLSAFPLPDTGACCMIGSCTSKFEVDCADIEGQQRWSVNTLCVNAGCPGACCDPMTGACGDFVEQATCQSGGGTYRGNSSACATSSCLGSCCKTDGTCGNEPPGYCTSISGIAGALGSTCGESTCIGACCQGQKGCEEVAYGLCPAADFKGIGSACAQQNCPCSSSVNVWADHDVDGDVDMDDFGQFQRCFAGTDGVVGAGCECLNHVNDGTIDGSDFIEFMNCATGAEVQWTQLLTPNCTP